MDAPPKPSVVEAQRGNIKTNKLILELRWLDPHQYQRSVGIGPRRGFLRWQSKNPTCIPPYCSPAMNCGPPWMRFRMQFQRCVAAITVHGRETRQARTERSLASAQLAVFEVAGHWIGFMRGTGTRTPSQSGWQKLTQASSFNQRNTFD